MGWIKAKANIILIGVSCVIALLIFELAYKYLIQKPSETPWGYDRFMLMSDYGEGSVFRNIDNFYVYQPRKTIRSILYFFKNRRWIKEYDYFIPTNNYGLVQTNNTKLHVPSILFLGDSNTEGLGASPWFEKLRQNFSQDSLQFVNAGILGTGFQQWQLLHDFLVNEGVNVKHVVVIFISHDYQRGIWNFQKRTLNCLADYHQCVGNENFYGIPPDAELNVYLEKLRVYREERALDHQVHGYSPKEFFAYYLPGITEIIGYLRDRTYGPEPNQEIQLNRNVISYLIARYKDNVLFVHIPQKTEVVYQKVSSLGEIARRDITLLGGELYDGHALCNLAEEDHFVNDGHPNESGYAKISACVTAAVKTKWSLQ